MFQVCLDDQSSSRLALVWLPPETPVRREVEPDARAASLLFSILDGKPARAKPKRRPRRAAKPH